MVKIRLVSNAENCFSAFESSGHADKSGKGGDIVCAAITILLKTAVLSLRSAQRESEDLKIEITADKPGYLSAKVKSFSDKDKPGLHYLFEFLTIGLMAVEADYADCLDLQIETI